MILCHPIVLIDTSPIPSETFQLAPRMTVFNEKRSNVIATALRGRDCIVCSGTLYYHSTIYFKQVHQSFRLQFFVDYVA